MPIFRVERRIIEPYKTPWGYERIYPFRPIDGHLKSGENIPCFVDDDTIYKFYKSIFIPQGEILRPSNRCKGLVIYCVGDCTINGTISMTARGARGAGRIFSPLGINRVRVGDELKDYSIGTTGGSGGPSRESSSICSINGVGGSNGHTGGGGSGRIYATNLSPSAIGGIVRSGSGSAGTTWSGGIGGGGAAFTRGALSSSIAGDGNINGGAGGNGRTLGSSYYTIISAGGGAGNNGGIYANNGSGGSNGSNGSGGLLILIVEGKLILNGSIISNGSNGGSGSSGGGSSGGGSITIIHRGNYTNNGSIQVNGGASVSGGGAGGAGSIRRVKGYI